MTNRSKITLGLYLIGLLHWYLFMQYGAPSFGAFDWQFMHQFLDVIKEGFRTQQIPYHASFFLDEYETGFLRWGDRFFATPWIMVSPQVILLSFLEVPHFMTVQMMLIYTIGFLGIWKWVKELDLSLTATTFLFVTFSFNGAHMAKFGMGHIHDCAYLLIPWFFWLMYKFIRNDNVSRVTQAITMIEYAFFLFFCLLQGSLHNVYQMALVGFCLMVFHWRKILWYLGSLVMTGLLSIYYVIPMFIFSYHAGRVDRTIFAGYGTVQAGFTGNPFIESSHKLLITPINIICHIWRALIVPYSALNDSTHEYSLYVSFLGAIILIVAMGYLLYREKPFHPGHKYFRLFLSICLVSLLSFSSVSMRIIGVLKKVVPFPAVDTLPSRLLIYPLHVILLMTSLFFDQLFKNFPPKIKSICQWIILGGLLGLLMFHSFHRSVAQTEKNFNLLINSQAVSEPMVYKTMIYQKQGDQDYKRIVWFSYGTSLFMVILFGYLYSRLKGKGETSNF